MSDQVKKTSKNAGVGKGTPGPGRPKGSTNKNTALLKDAILQAAEAAGNDLGAKSGEGIREYLKLQAIENPGPFLSLMGKVLPIQMANAENDDGTVQPLRVIFESAGDDPGSA